MEVDLLSLVPFKLELILISYDFKDIPKYLTPTIETQLSRTSSASLHVIQAGWALTQGFCIIPQTKNKSL
jgi:hypothetical protein